ERVRAEVTRVLDRERERIVTGAFAELRQQRDLAPAQLLKRGADRAEDRPRANGDPAHHAERAHGAVAVEEVGGGRHEFGSREGHGWLRADGMVRYRSHAGAG